MLDLPRVGTAMYVVDAAGTNYRSRLEEVSSGLLTLSAPLETTGPTLPWPGQQLEVYWAQTRARVILPSRLIEIADLPPYRWTIAADGSPQQSNRREFVRGAGGGPVQLVVVADDDSADETVAGRLLDISEGGLRCWVPRAPRIGPDDRLRALVRLGKDDMDLAAAVLSVREATDEPGKHVILSFQIGERVARVIRQHVFAWEIAERRQYELR